MLGGIRPRHADPGDVLAAHRIDGDHRRQRGVNAAAQSDQDLRKTAFVDVVARAQHQRLVGGFVLIGEILVTVAAPRIGVAQHQVLFKGPRAGDDFARMIHGEAGAVEDQLVVAAHLVHVHHGLFIAPRRGPVDIPPDGALLQVVGRGVDAEEHLRAGLEQFLHRVALIEALLPEAAVVPGVLADG